jgi:hypothetical protein
VTLTLSVAENLFKCHIEASSSSNPPVLQHHSNAAAMENVPGMFGLGGNQTKEEKKQVAKSTALGDSVPECTIADPH